MSAKTMTKKKKRPESILQEAHRLTHGQRNQDYADPVVNFKHIAGISSAILRKDITSQDVAVVMLAVKLSREMHRHKRDNLVDIAGYAWCWSKIEGEDG